MTRLYLVRHGQTDWNRQERFRGRIDLPLNDVGRAQAQAVAAHLRAETLSVVYSSPLGRAVETARPVAEAHGLPVLISSGLIDIHYGEWQGRSPAEVRESSPELLDRWHAAPHLADIPGGERLEAVRARAWAAVQDMLARHPGAGIVLVTHQIVIKVLACTLLGLEVAHIWRVRQDNACLDIFEWDGSQFTVLLVNGTDHLGRSPAYPVL